MSDRDDMIATDNALSVEARRALQMLVGMIIPPSDEYGVPGADDPQIFADILAKAHELPAVIQGLKVLDELSNARSGDGFCALDEDDRIALAEEFRRSQVSVVRVLVAITAQCYYIDDRVVEALGMEVRSPFPGGFTVEEGDWSLLEPVRKRPKMYRESP
jgi:hypothetical protein